MIIPKYKEVVREDLQGIEIVPGNIILVKDQLECYYDTSDSKRINIGSIVMLATEDEKDAIMAPLSNKLYFVSETLGLYVYSNSEWKDISVKMEAFVLDILSKISEDENGDFMYNGKSYSSLEPFTEEDILSINTTIWS